MAVGDPHQSIYGWRGASAANLGRFSLDFTGSARRCAASTPSPPPGAIPLACSMRRTRWSSRSSASSPVHVERLGARPGASPGELDVRFEQTVADEAEAIAALARASGCRRRDDDGRPPSAAMLCRSIKKIDAFTGALARHGIPYHVLGLGGLLEQPVIADLVSAMRVMHDPTAGSELIRVLTGARWRIGPKDIATLRSVASWLAARDHRFRELDPRRARAAAAVGRGRRVGFARRRPRLRRRSAGRAHAARGIQSRGPARGCAPPAASSTTCARGSASTCSTSSPSCSRSCCSTSRSPPTRRAQLGQASLDAFAEQVASYLASDDQATLGSFLSWLAEAEQRDNLAPRSEDPEPGTVQILTIHGSKGLEWDIVAVPRMVDGELPGGPLSKRGWLEFGALPFEFRGDASELPMLGLAHRGDAERRRRGGRRRSRTRSSRGTRPSSGGSSTWPSHARATACCSPARTGRRRRKPRGPGLFLLELQAAGLIAPDAFPECDEPDENPLTLSGETVLWPLDPLGSRRSRVRGGRRARCRRRRARHRLGRRLRARHRSAARRARHARRPTPGWSSCRRASPRRGSRTTSPIPRPSRRALRRPMPERPYRQTRLGTLFHGWVEQRYGTVAGGLGCDRRRGRPSSTIPPASCLEARRARRAAAHVRGQRLGRSPPAEVEIEIHVTLAGQVVVCKLDAVYPADDGAHTSRSSTGRPARRRATPTTSNASSCSWRSTGSPTPSTPGIDPDEHRRRLLLRRRRPRSSGPNASTPKRSCARSGPRPRASCRRRDRSRPSCGRPGCGRASPRRRRRPGSAPWRSRAACRVRVHAVDQPVEHLDRVVDDGLVAHLATVQQPSGDLELGVEHRALRELPVGGDLAGRGVRAERAAGRIRAHREKPVQVAGGIADTQRRPAEHRGDAVLLDEERVDGERAVDDGGLELPQRVVGGGVTPPVAQRARQQSRRRGATRCSDVVECGTRWR